MKTRPDMEFLKFLLILVLSSRGTSDCQDQQRVNMLLNNHFPPYLMKDEETRTPGVDSKGMRNVYHGQLEKGINEVISKCSQKCTSIEWNNALINNADEVIKRLHENTTAMFVFPIPVEVGKKISQYYHNDSTVQVIASQKQSNLIMMVDIGRCREDLSYEIFQIIRKQSPILPIVFLLAAIAGVILWVLEARQNAQEFSSSFFRGTFDGFWWAFISMTTVGYGDKTPRTMLGRVFAMIWIIMGIVIISFFTATIASTITIATVEKSCHTLKNRNVAIISTDTKVKDYVTEQGAKSIKEFDSFPAMFKAWRNKEAGINSLFVEEHTALMYFYGRNDNSAIKDVRVTKSTKDVKQLTLFYVVVKKSPSTGSALCGLNTLDLKELLSIPDLPKPPEMYKSSFEEEVDQPLSIDSPETKPILIILSICCASLAVSGYIGITIINWVKGKKKKAKFDKAGASSHEMEKSYFTKLRLCQLQQSLNLIAQEVKEMKEVLDAYNA